MKNLSKVNKMRAGILLMVLFLAVAVTAQPNKGHKHGNKASKAEKMSNFLQLTEEQETKISALFAEHRKAMQMNKLDIAEKRLELKRLTVSETADQKKIDAVIDEIFNLKATATKQGFAFKNSIKAELTEEQAAKFEAMNNRHKQIAKHRKGHARGKAHGQKPYHGKGPKG